MENINNNNNNNIIIINKIKNKIKVSENSKQLFCDQLLSDESISVFAQPTQNR